MSRAPVIADKTLRAMLLVFAAYPELREVILFGSRATGRANERSDIDLATLGVADGPRLSQLEADLDNLPAPQKWDVCAYETIKSAPFKKHIDEFGIRIYQKTNAA